MNGIDNFIIALATITVLNWFICKVRSRKMKPFLINAMASVVIASVLGVIY